MKNAIVTGCMGGIGSATVSKLISAGFFVIGSDLPAAAAVADKLAAFGEHFVYVPSDVSSSEDRANLLKTALTYGEIFALVNVAGIAPRVRADLLEMTEESYDRVMNVNTKSMMFLTQAVANEMKNNSFDGGVRGHIVNISSMSAYTSSISRGEYCISKAGASMITALFADRLSEYNIPVNEIRPGIIMTGMTETVKAKYDNLIAGGLLPLARWGMPEDIASAVCAFVTNNLPYVTGQSLDVDGGFHIRRL